jgi:uncharacterized protein (TIGR02246 family)
MHHCLLKRLGTPARLRMLCAAAAMLLASAAPAAEKKSGQEADVAAIRAAVDSYIAAYNRGDAAAVAAHWSPTGQWTSPAGESVQGPKAIEKELRAWFATNKGVRIEVIDPKVRLVTADVALEEGRAREIHPDEAPSDSSYLAVHVKKDGHWKLDSIHETELPAEPATTSPLQELAWLVGQWGDESAEADVVANVSWTKNNAFLNYSFKVSAPGIDELEGTQVIGWDPAAGTIRSWMFDSDAGFGEGLWTKKDNSWIVKFTQVLPDGRKASATNIYTQVDNDTCTWKSIGRQVDGQFLPNVEEVKMVRKKAEGPTSKDGKPQPRPEKKPNS